MFKNIVPRKEFFNRCLESESINLYYIWEYIKYMNTGTFLYKGWKDGRKEVFCDQ